MNKKTTVERKPRTVITLDRILENSCVASCNVVKAGDKLAYTFALRDAKVCFSSEDRRDSFTVFSLRDVPAILAQFVLAD